MATTEPKKKKSIWQRLGPKDKKGPMKMKEPKTQTNEEYQKERSEYLRKQREYESNPRNAPASYNMLGEALMSGGPMAAVEGMAASAAKPAAQGLASLGTNALNFMKGATRTGLPTAAKTTAEAARHGQMYETGARMLGNDPTVRGLVGLAKLGGRGASAVGNVAINNPVTSLLTAGTIAGAVAPGVSELFDEQEAGVPAQANPQQAALQQEALAQLQGQGSPQSGPAGYQELIPFDPNYSEHMGSTDSGPLREQSPGPMDELRQLAQPKEHEQVAYREQPKGNSFWNRLGQSIERNNFNNQGITHETREMQRLNAIAMQDSINRMRAGGNTERELALQQALQQQANQQGATEGQLAVGQQAGQQQSRERAGILAGRAMEAPMGQSFLNSLLEQSGMNAQMGPEEYQQLLQYFQAQDPNRLMELYLGARQGTGDARPVINQPR